MLFAGCGLLAIAGPAAAQSCKDAGQLFYLGNTRGDAQSIWLSQTAEAGNFRLEAAQQNRLVDRWSREQQSLRLSLSDTVSNGSGGTHRLFIEPAQRGNGKDCLIDTHNQKVDFTLPPAFQRPPQKPDQTLPLAPERPPPPPVTGLMPGRPPGTPDQTLPTIPPSGVMPGLPSPPPSGVMPGRPPGTPDQTLPTLPPSGVMPTRPPGTPEQTLPTVPPSGVMPGLPSPPPSGVMPTRPPGTPDQTLPTLPPSGVMPTRPPGTPDQTLPTIPPSGVMPGLPSPPPSGVMPGRPPGTPDQTLPTIPPSGVVPGLPSPPPSGVMPTRPPGTPDQTLPTLPPSGVMPTRPPGTPDQTLPTIPPTGVMPERPSRPPAGVTPEVPVAPDLPDRPLAPVVPGAPELPDRRPYGPAAPQVEDRSGATERADPHDRACRSDPEGSYPDDADWPRDCRPGQPLTEGRRYLEPTDWDIWSDIRITAVEKGGNPKLVDGETLTASFGIDNRVAENLVLGVSGMFSDGSTDSYGGLLKSGTSGFSFGPYLAWLVAEHVTFDLSASWGRVENDIQLFDLATSFTTDVLSLSSDITFDTMVDGVALRPKVGVSYTRSSNEDHALRGAIMGRQVDLALPGTTSELASAEMAIEAAAPIAYHDDDLVIPFLELGAKWDFLRPDHAQFDTSVNRIVSPGEWSGYANGGLRFVIDRNLTLEVSGAYRSIGVENFDIWEGRLYVSFAFWACALVSVTEYRADRLSQIPRSTQRKPICEVELSIGWACRAAGR